MSAESVTGKPLFDCKGLAEELEQDPVIRSHLRGENAVLFPDGHPESVKNSCQDPIYAVLQQMCLRTAMVEGHPQPGVLALREELELLYKKCGAQVHEGTIINDSWCIRKFLSFIKMKVRKEMVSTVSGIYLRCMFSHVYIFYFLRCLHMYNCSIHI